MTQFFQKTKELFFKSLLPILVSLFFVVAVIYAVWTEPEVAPPDGNVDAPLNVGSVSQQKIGPLILNTGGAATGLIVDQGNVGIGTTNPGAKLEIAGQIKITGGTPGAGQVLTTLDASGLATWEIPAGGSGFWTASGANIYNLNSGNVGIGTASPSQKLHVSVSSGNVAQRLSSGTNNAYWAVAGSSGSYSSIAVAGDVVLRSDGGDLILQGRNAGDIFFTTGNPDSVKMTILNSGNVGIGLSGPSQLLHIDGIVQAATFYASTGVSTFGTSIINPGVVKATSFCLDDGETNCVSGTWPSGGAGLWTASGANIYNSNSGNVGIGITSPGARLNVLDTFRVGTTALAGLDYSRGSGDLYLGGDNGQSGNFRIKNSAGAIQVAINSDASSYFNGGNVGIGLSGPSQLLHIDGIVQAATFYASTGVSTFGTSIINPGVVKATSFCLDDGETNCVSGTWPSGGAGLWTASGANIYNSNSGNVGIGDTTPTFKLDITGNLRATTDIRADDDLIFFGELMPDGVTCSNGQILKRTGSNNWDCAADDTGGSGLWTASGANIYNSNSGNVGIGATSPTIDLAIGDNDSGLNSTGDGVLDLWANGGARVQVRDTRVTVTNDLYIGSQRVCREDGTGCPARVVSTCTASVMPTVCTATCPAGYEVTGGGMNNALSGGTIISFDSFPNSDTSWVCGLNATFGATNSMTCYAVCRRQ